jgi:outer membrane protein
MVLMGVGLLRTALASTECQGPSDDCVAVRSWHFSLSLGLGVRTNPLREGRDIPLVIVPQFSYYGKRFFVENLDLGFTLADARNNTVSLIGSPGYDRVFFYRTDLQNFFVAGADTAFSTNRPTLAHRQFPARPRRVTYLAGPEWTFRYRGLSGQLDLLHEVTGRNHGDEIRGAVHIPLIESVGALSANVGFTWKSAAIVNYYYGIPNAYQAGADFNPFVKVGYSRPLGGRWKLQAFVHLERLGNAIADSPIVGQRYVTTVFAGARYDF